MSVVKRDGDAAFGEADKAMLEDARRQKSGVKQQMDEEMARYLQASNSQAKLCEDQQQVLSELNNIVHGDLAIANELRSPGVNERSAEDWQLVQEQTTCLDAQRTLMQRHQTLLQEMMKFNEQQCKISKRRKAQKLHMSGLESLIKDLEEQQKAATEPAGSCTKKSRTTGDPKPRIMDVLADLGVNCNSRTPTEILTEAVKANCLYYDQNGNHQPFDNLPNKELYSLDIHLDLHKRWYIQMQKFGSLNGVIGVCLRTLEGMGSRKEAITSSPDPYACVYCYGVCIRIIQLDQRYRLCLFLGLETDVPNEVIEEHPPVRVKVEGGEV